MEIPWTNIIVGFIFSFIFLGIVFFILPKVEDNLDERDEEKVIQALREFNDEL